MSAFVCAEIACVMASRNKTTIAARVLLLLKCVFFIAMFFVIYIENVLEKFHLNEN